MLENDLAEMILRRENHPHKKKGLARSLMHMLSIQDTPCIFIDYACFSLAINACISA